MISLFTAQPAGQPEISRMSLHMSPLTGGQSLFVIGKNFVKGFRVKFQELEKGSEEIAWEQEADVDHEFTHTVSHRVVLVLCMEIVMILPL